MQVEVSDYWVSAGAIIGTLAAGAITAFRMQYSKSREGERASAASSPIVAAGAIGAAFVDRATAQDISVIREDLGVIRKLAEDRKEHDDEDRVKRVAREAALEVARQQGPASKRRGAGDD